MNNINTAVILFFRDRKVFVSTILSKLSFLFNDKLYLSLQYKLKVGEKINWKSPTKFTEKIQWLKLYDRKPVYSDLVDKYNVKKIVASRIGNQYIIPTLGIWNSIDEIEWEKLPQKFVLKTTHGGGSLGVIIVEDKNVANKTEILERLKKALKQNIYKSNKEWPYKNVKPRILAEVYMSDSSNKDLDDYKFYCFNGEPKFCQVIRDRHTKETIDFYDMDWNHMPFIGLIPLSKGIFSELPKNGIFSVPKPQHLSKIIEICRVLSEDIPFSRIDMYIINGNLYFGEITFYPAGGFGIFSPDEWNKKLGDLILLPHQ